MHHISESVSRCRCRCLLLFSFLSADAFSFLDAFCLFFYIYKGKGKHVISRKTFKVKSSSPSLWLLLPEHQEEDWPMLWQLDRMFLNFDLFSWCELASHFWPPSNLMRQNERGKKYSFLKPWSSDVSLDQI